MFIDCSLFIAENITLSSYNLFGSTSKCRGKYVLVILPKNKNVVSQKISWSEKYRWGKTLKHKNLESTKMSKNKNVEIQKCRIIVLWYFSTHDICTTTFLYHDIFDFRHFCIPTFLLFDIFDIFVFRHICLTTFLFFDIIITTFWRDIIFFLVLRLKTRYPAMLSS